jgi:hypothetical protein
MNNAPLIPPDLEHCQAIFDAGSFMTLGPRVRKQCGVEPIWIATEAVAGSDGRIGSMSVCERCMAEMAKTYPRGTIKFRRIER